MYYELYLDVLFLQNLLADYLLLTILKGSLKCQAGRLRRLAGAAEESAKTIRKRKKAFAENASEKGLTLGLAIVSYRLTIN